MKIIDKFQHIKLKTALELFVPMFVMEHNWNVEDKYEDLFASKKAYLIKLLVDERKQGRLNGDVKGHFIDKNGNEAIKEDSEPFFLLDQDATWFDINETFQLLFGILQKNGAASFSTFIDSDVTLQNNEKNSADDFDVIDADIIESVESMSLPTLKKKVKELTAEKVKWDRSIVASAKVGLLFYEKDLPRPATENEFKAEFKKYFEGLPGTTITKIYKNLPIAPIQYKKTGDAPTKNSDADPIIRSAVFAGFKEGTEGDVTGHELVAALRDEGYEVPDETILQKILEAMNKLK